MSNVSNKKNLSVGFADPVSTICVTVAGYYMCLCLGFSIYKIGIIEMTSLSGENEVNT